jgi:hypothetical protein
MSLPMNDPATRSVTIDDVVARMDRVLDRCIERRSRLGYFTVLYRDVTVRVRDEIRAHRFDDGERMERLDVVFASRYLAAVEQYWAGTTPTKSWTVAFESALRWRPIVLQHLLLGMNAHINLDLAIAAAQTAPGSELPALERDFDRISGLLTGMIEDVQNRLVRISPWMRVVDMAGGRSDEEIVGFGVSGARDVAWQAARRLAVVPRPQLDQAIALQDHVVATLARGILAPRWIVGWALGVVRVSEPRDVCAVIERLRA